MSKPTGIVLSNGREIRYAVAPGALGFDGKGYFWEWPLVWLGFIKLKVFDIIFVKTLTRWPRKGNLNWWNPFTWLPFSPWSCIKFLADGSPVNKVGLSNKGFDWWFNHVAPRLDFFNYNIGVSIYGTMEELVMMAGELNHFNLATLHVNTACPNTGTGLTGANYVIACVKAVKAISKHPIVVSISAGQDYITIAKGLVGVAEALSPNSVPFEKIFPCDKSPLWRIQKRDLKKTGKDSGGGGVSAWAAQSYNWQMIREIREAVPGMPVFTSSVMEYADLENAERQSGEIETIVFGTCFMKTPFRPNQIIAELEKD